MTDSWMLDAEARLSKDHDGSYKAELIGRLENYQDQFAGSKQGFLEPDEYDILEHLERCIQTAIAVIKDYRAPSADTAGESEAAFFVP